MSNNSSNNPNNYTTNDTNDTNHSDHNSDDEYYFTDKEWENLSGEKAVQTTKVKCSKEMKEFLQYLKSKRKEKLDK